MIRPGERNLITDIDGIRVGNAEDIELRSGTTVILPDRPCAMAVDVRGGGPGTRDTDALDPTCLVETFHGLVLSGGSVFGLAAADGVTAWLSEDGVGLPLGPKALPVVPGAILFDLVNGGDKDWGDINPYVGLGRSACDAATRDFSLGNAGAGMGATAGSLKGGLGSVSAIDGEVEVGALIAANPFGEVVIPGSRTFWAWAMECENEYGGQPPPAALAGPLPLDFPKPGISGTNTTIGVVATNVALSKAQLQRVAIMAQDGLSRAIRPAHTPFDGDTIFALSTGTDDPGSRDPALEPMLVARIGAMAADCVARAIARGVYEAETLGDAPGYRG